MDLRFKEGVHCSDITTIKDDDGQDVHLLNNINLADFFDQIMEDEIMREFFEDEDTRNKIVTIIGLQSLLNVYDRNEILAECSWDYVKEFFLDNIDEQAILDHIGWEKVREHFADHIETDEEESPNDINIGDGPSMMEALHGDRGKDSPSSI